MFRLETKIDTNSAAYKENYTTMTRAVEEE